MHELPQGVLRTLERLAVARGGLLRGLADRRLVVLAATRVGAAEDGGVGAGVDPAAQLGRAHDRERVGLLLEQRELDERLADVAALVAYLESLR